MASEKLTKRTVDAAEPRETRYTIFDTIVPGFGLRVFPSGQKSWVFDYRPGEGGRRTMIKRVTIGLAASADGKKQPDFTADGARKVAERLRGAVANGQDPQADRAAQREAPTVAEIAELFLTNHVDAKRGVGTKVHYEDILRRIVLPAVGTVKAKDLKRSDMAKLHMAWRSTPVQANRMLAVVGSLYAYAGGPAGHVPEGTNPVRGIEKFEEHGRERLLTNEELERLGASMREAETTGIPWTIDDSKNNKHLAKGRQTTIISGPALAALRLLVFTGCRLREILHLRWDQVDFERGLLLLEKHKTSRKTGTKAVILNAPAVAILAAQPRTGVYVIGGDSAGQEGERPRSDLKKPWAMVRKRAGLDDLRIHDLRHSFASVGAGSGMGLPIIGKLLGHTQPSTTARYAHLDTDPLRRASNTIGATLAAAMGDAPAAQPNNVVPIKKGA